MTHHSRVIRVLNCPENYNPTGPRVFKPEHDTVQHTGMNCETSRRYRWQPGRVGSAFVLYPDWLRSLSILKMDHQALPGMPDGQSSPDYRTAF